VLGDTFQYLFLYFYGFLWALWWLLIFLLLFNLLSGYLLHLVVLLAYGKTVRYAFEVQNCIPSPLTAVSVCEIWQAAILEPSASDLSKLYLETRSSSTVYLRAAVEHNFCLSLAPVK
jgi:hypothetical protein